MFLLLACTDGGAETATPDTETPARGDCNPLQPEHCLLPFPSSFFLREADTPTGWQVDFGPTSLPLSSDGVQMAPDGWNRKDGFPIVGPLYALLPGAVVEGAGHAHFDAIGSSVDGSGSSLLVDAETGGLVPHYIEREAFPEDPLRAALVIHPAGMLEPGRRYVVGLRGFTDEAGAAIAAPSGFATLRDGAETEDPDLERQRATYEDLVFPTLEAAGADRAELQLAWDFVTESQEGGLAQMRRLRELGEAQVGAGGPAYTLTRVEDGDCTAGNRARLVEGAMTLPLFLTSADPGAELVLDDEGLPIQNGTTEVGFTLAVSCAAFEDPGGALLIQGGHGLFGTHEYLGGDPWLAVAQAARGVSFGTTWRGLGEDDYASIIDMMLNEPSRFHMIGNQLMQGQFEALMLARLVQGDLATDPALMVEDQSIVAGGELVYLGVSLGSVVGGAQVAMSPDIERAAMMIPGAPFSGLLTRSSAFEAFLALLGTRYDDPVDVSLFVPLAQMHFQPAETGGWAHALVDGSAVGGRADRRFLFQVGIGDDTVTSLGGATYARMVGAGLLEPAPREVWGIEADAAASSGMLEWDYGVSENPEPAPQGLDPDPHWLLPGDAAAIAQAAAFLAGGELASRCDGVCP